MTRISFAGAFLLKILQNSIKFSPEEVHELAPVKVQDEVGVAEVGPHAELEAWRRLVRLLFRDVA